MPLNAVTHALWNRLHAALRRGEAGGTDGQLLERFVAGRDGAAFEALVGRHGPMVLGVCRRVLGHAQDAEDAFQATFLVLARKAAAVRPADRVANWLHGVAHKTALKARALAARRRRRERPLAAVPEPAARPGGPDPDLYRLLDRAVRGLAAAYREPLILCELEGRSYREAARQLGVSEGTISVRLVRARKMLARRLAGQGVALAAGPLALAVPQASASLPPALVASTVQAVVTGPLPARVATLTHGVLQAMVLSKLKTATALLLLIGLFGAGAAVFPYPSQAAPPAATPVPSPAAVPPARAPQPLPDAEAILGTWAVVRLDQVNHQPTKDEQAYLASGQFWLVITADRLIYPDRSEGRYTLDPTRQPRRMTLTTVVNGTAVAAPAIYALQGDDLRICMGRGGDREPPAGFDVTKAVPGTFPTCWTLKRIPPGAKAAAGGKQQGQQEGRPAGAAAMDEELLRGQWQAVAGETSNENLPPAVLQGIRLTFTGAKVTLTRGKEGGEAAVTLNPTKTPKEIDLAVSDGSRGAGIYELDQGRLKVCMVEAKDEPRPTEFVAKGRQVVLVFQRVDPAKPGPAADKPTEVPTPAEQVLRQEVATLRALVESQKAALGRLQDELVVARRDLAAVLQAVDVARNTVAVTLGGTTLRVDGIGLAPGVRFSLDGKECTLNDLQAGMSVGLTFGTDAEKCLVTAIRAATPKKGVKD